MRPLALALCASVSLGCGASARRGPETPSDVARRDGPSSRDPEIVGRWWLAELVAPGGTRDAADRAKQRLADLGGDPGMYGGLARGVDGASRGELVAAADGYVASLKAAQRSRDPLAPSVAWLAASNLLAIEGATPGVFAASREWIDDALRHPGSLGWRARSELVEWWSRHAYDAAESGLLEKTAERYGCAKHLRIAGPFGRAVASDRWASFAAEAPGPWPARWPADADRAAQPRVLRTERHGCTVRADEPVSPGIYYAETYLDVKEEREIILAAQGSLAIWVDDHQVQDRDPRRWAVWPRFGVGLRLSPGRHRVLARLTEPELSLRVMRADGSPSDVETSTDATPPYVTAAPTRTNDPNVLSRWLDRPIDAPRDALESFLAAVLASVDGQPDLASVLIEPLHQQEDAATGLALATAASFAEKDPIFPESDARDLARMLREKGLKKDPSQVFAKLWLAIDKSDKGMPEATRAIEQLMQESPGVPEIPRVLLSLYARLGWKAERARTAKLLAERFPADRGALEAAIVVLEEQGKLAEADALAKRVRELAPDAELDLDRAIARRDWKAAQAELDRLAKRRPDRRDIEERRLQLRVRSGETTDPVPAIERALKRNPRDGAARLALADSAFARGDRRALRNALAAAIGEGYGEGELRAAVELVEGTTELEPFRRDARAVIAEYERVSRPQEGTAARVLDYATLWIHGDGSARMLEHEIIRVQSQEAIGKLAEQRVPQGALVLRMRVLKKDGRVLEPERVPGKPTITMPHLELGDYLETEYVTAQETDGEGGKRYLSPRWFFREADIAYWRSEYVVVSPKDRPLVVETTGAVPAATTEDLGPMTVRRWRVDRSPAAPVEPQSVPVQEFLPSVQLGWGLSDEGQLRRLVDATSQQLPRDPRLTRVAERIVGDTPRADPRERARRLYRWVSSNVEDGREADGRRVVVGKSGSRAAAFLYLARALELPVELAAVRDRLRPRDVGPLTGPLGWNRVVLRLDLPCAAGAPAPSCPLWMTVGERNAPFGYLPAELRGQPAVRLLAGLPPDTTPSAGSIDGIVYDGKAELRADGSAVLELDQRFLGRVGIGIRDSVDQLPEEQLRAAVESKLLQRALPGGRLVSLAVLDKDDLDKPVTFRMKVELSDFARRRGDGLALRPPLTMKIGPLAALERRETPMILPEATHTEVRLTVKLPSGASVVEPPRPVELRDGDRVVRIGDAASDGSLRIERVIDLPAGRVQPEEYGAFRRFSLAVDEATAREILVHLR